MGGGPLLEAAGLQPCDLAGAGRLYRGQLQCQANGVGDAGGLKFLLGGGQEVVVHVNEGV